MPRKKKERTIFNLKRYSIRNTILDYLDIIYNEVYPIKEDLIIKDFVCKYLNIREQIWYTKEINWKQTRYIIFNRINHSKIYFLLCVEKKA